jgi:hypothetical protein
MNQDLAAFVAHARARALDFATIRALLLTAGWREEEISAAFAAEALDRPVPSPRVVGTARDAFFHVLAFTALYTWVIALIVLAFQYVNLALPDPAWVESHWFGQQTRAAIRQALASVVVAFPLFLVLWRLLLRDLARHPEKARSRLRRGLIYVSLFVASVTLLSDVITLVYQLFEGELTQRFLLKATILFVVTGGVFVYLALTLKTDVQRAK